MGETAYCSDVDVPHFGVALRFGVQSPIRRRLDVKNRYTEERVIDFLREADAGEGAVPAARLQ